MFELLVVHKRRGTVQTVALHPARVWLLGVLALLVALLAALTLWTGTPARLLFEGSHVRAEESRALAQAREEIDQLERERAELARRVVSVEARIFRVEAVGARLADRLGVDSVDLEAEPGVGGPADYDDEAPALSDGTDPLRASPEDEGPDAPLSGSGGSGPDEPEAAVLLRHAYGRSYPEEGETLGDESLIATLERLERRLIERAEDLALLETLYAFQKENRQVRPAGRPVREGWLSSGFGRRRDPFTGAAAFHRGLDYSGRHRSDVIAVASGVVTFTGTRGGYGRTVEIQHGDGLKTRYAHNDEIVVRRGDVVQRGDVISLMGSTGRSTATHVHFEVIRDGKYVDPVPFVRASATELD